MYKIYSGRKCITISSGAIKISGKGTRVIPFRSAEELHKEYRQFVRSTSLQTLVITGDEKRIWKVFRSLFGYIEAAGGVVRNPKGELLMIYRNKHWDLPKGKMEKGETPDQTALREVEEECGVKQLKVDKELAITHHIFMQDKNAWIKRTYWYEMSCKDPAKPTPQAIEGILKAEWLSKEEVKKNSNKIYDSLREVLVTASFLSR